MVNGVLPLLRRSKAFSLLAIALVLSGCGLRPEPLTQGDHLGRARADRLALFAKYRPVEKDLTLADVLARGLIDNLDHRLAMMEQVLEAHRLNRVQYDMLPTLAAEAGYDWRDKEAASTSISLLTGAESLQPSYSAERAGIDSSLRFSWSVLDFGLSYFQAKQQADRVLIAVETRRRVLNNTTRDIISAYYRALAAEKLLPRVRKGIADTQKAIDASDKARDEKLVPASQMLSYKRDLLQYLVALRNHEALLQRSREELATLINVPIDQLRLARTSTPGLPRISTSIEDLQDYALVHRAELREEAYRERIERQVVYQETLRLFPGLSVLGSFNYDSNKYLYYSNWRELGLRATYNLLDVLKAVQDKKTAEAQVEYTQMRRIALSAAILAQTAISYYQYQEARSTNRTAAQLSDVEGALLQAARDAEEAQVGSVLERIRQQTASVSAQIEEDRSYAEAQTALASLLVSVGYDFVPAAMDIDDPAVLAEKISPALSDLQKGRLPRLEPEETTALTAPATAVEAAVISEDAKAVEGETNKKGFWQSLFARDADKALPAATTPVREAEIVILDKRRKADIVLDAWRRTETAAPVTLPIKEARPRVEAEAEPIAPAKHSFLQRLFAPAPSPAPEAIPEQAAAPMASPERASVVNPTPVPEIKAKDIVWQEVPAPKESGVAADTPPEPKATEDPGAGASSETKPGFFSRLFARPETALETKPESETELIKVPAPATLTTKPDIQVVTPEKIATETLESIEKELPTPTSVSAAPPAAEKTTNMVPASLVPEVVVEDKPVPAVPAVEPVKSDLPALKLRDVNEIIPPLQPRATHAPSWMDVVKIPSAPPPGSAVKAAPASPVNTPAPSAPQLEAPLVPKPLPTRIPGSEMNRAQALEVAEINKHINCPGAAGACDPKATPQDHQ